MKKVLLLFVAMLTCSLMQAQGLENHRKSWGLVFDS